MKSDKKPIVFGYVRVSTDNQLENYSIDEQIQRITSYCQAKDWELLKIYIDGGFSGGNTTRPALQQMLSDISNTKIDTVVVYKLDRLSRSQKDTLTLIEDEFLAQGVDFVSINENFDTSTPFGRAMIGILSVFAQLEKDQITERFTMGRIGRGKAGYYHGGGIIPAGYNYIDGQLIVDEYKAIQIREIFDLFLNGKSINSIWHEMENKYGGKWSASKIRTILLNSVYIGKVKFAGVEYDGNHQPIISNDIFKIAGNLLASAKREDSKSIAQKTPFRAGYLLSGLINCQRCKARYSANHGYYKCYSRSKSSARFIKDPDCKNNNLEIVAFDDLIVSQVNYLICRESLLEKALNITSEKTINLDEQTTTKRIKEIDGQIDRLLGLYQQETLPVDTLTLRINQLNQKKNTLKQQLMKNKEATPSQGKNFLENTGLFRERFDASPLDTKRLLLSSLIEAIWIDGQDVSIKWRI